jgi:hypothetical protein
MELLIRYSLRIIRFGIAHNQSLAFRFLLKLFLKNSRFYLKNMVLI